jgi:hypothetical protein
MMMEINETVGGISYAIQEIDEELTGLIPNLKRRKCTPRVMEEADALLDMRNDLTSILGELAFDEYERMMTE